KRLAGGKKNMEQKNMEQKKNYEIIVGDALHRRSVNFQIQQNLYPNSPNIPVCARRTTVQ
ncbi:MAG: hypothetical protein RR413_11680, partial [Christensenellaceae bacterium]